MYSLSVFIISESILSLVKVDHPHFAPHRVVYLVCIYNRIGPRAMHIWFHLPVLKMELHVNF